MEEKSSNYHTMLHEAAASEAGVWRSGWTNAKFVLDEIELSPCHFCDICRRSEPAMMSVELSKSLYTEQMKWFEDVMIKWYRSSLIRGTHGVDGPRGTDYVPQIIYVCMCWKVGHDLRCWAPIVVRWKLHELYFPRFRDFAISIRASRRRVAEHSRVLARSPVEDELSASSRILSNFVPKSRGLDFHGFSFCNSDLV